MEQLQNSFLQDIIAHPQEDSLRLIFADWLEDHSQPERAKFIRTGVEIEKIRQHCFCSTCVDKRGGGQYTNGPCVLQNIENTHLLAEEYKLLVSGHGLKWIFPIAEATGCPLDLATDGKCYQYFGTYSGTFRGSQDHIVWKWKKGFVGEIECDIARWISCGKSLVRVCPLEKVTLSGLEPADQKGKPGGRNRVFCWWSTTGNAPEFVHSAIFQYLKPKEMGNSNVRRYKTRQEAVSDLSRAALTWAKTETE